MSAGAGPVVGSDGVSSVHASSTACSIVITRPVDHAVSHWAGPIRARVASMSRSRVSRSTGASGTPIASSRAVPAARISVARIDVAGIGGDARESGEAFADALPVAQIHLQFEAFEQLGAGGAGLQTGTTDLTQFVQRGCHAGTPAELAPQGEALLVAAGRPVEVSGQKGQVSQNVQRARRAILETVLAVLLQAFEQDRLRSRVVAFVIGDQPEAADDRQRAEPVACPAVGAELSSNSWRAEARSRWSKATCPSTCRVSARPAGSSISRHRFAPSSRCSRAPPASACRHASVPAPSSARARSRPGLCALSNARPSHRRASPVRPRWDQKYQSAPASCRPVSASAGSLD